MVAENKYQAHIIKRIKEIFPDVLILKNDPSYQQGVPDLVILWFDCWASLEVKSSAPANRQPNQDYFIEKLDEMSFAAYIYPENEEEVLSALQQAFESPRRARVSES